MAINGTFTPLSGNFTMCDNEVMFNTSISPEARFIYGLIQSKITNPKFTVYKNTIFNLFGGSKQRFDKYWNELKQIGLLVIHKLRDEKNQFCYQYELAPASKALHGQAYHPDPDFPPMETPKNGNSTTWETKSYNNTELTDTELTKTELNNTTTLLLDDDRLSNQSSSQKNKVDLSLFIKTWLEVTEHSILLTEHQKKALTRLIHHYSYQTVLCAVQKIKESQYLMHNINVMHFIKCFEKIYSDTYKDRVHIKNQSQMQDNGTKMVAQERHMSPFKKTRFNIMDSRQWDFDELDRLEWEYIERKLQSRK